MDNVEQTYRQLLADNIDLIRERCWYYSGTDKRLFVELLHEVYADLWYAMSLFDPTYSPLQQRQWVKGRCHGVYKRHRRLLGPSLLPLVEDVPDDITPEVLRESVEELAEDLADGERRLLDLLLQGYSQAECAERLGISRPAVNKRYRRMIEKMKQRYKKNLRL
jgi:RNA polymerase sigma factor (sigma-70 family)